MPVRTSLAAPDPDEPKIKNEAARPVKAEKGYTVQQATSWFYSGVETEETPELRWPKSNVVYDAMRRQDAQVKSVLRAVTLPILRTTWRIDPNGARARVTQQIADDLGLPILGKEKVAPRRTAGRFQWGEHLAASLLCLPYGHAFFEQVYRVDDRGMVRLRKLGYRPPRTIRAIDVARDGGLVGIRQFAPGGDAANTDDINIPVDRLVAYVHEREGGNWIGNSLLRPAYKFWVLKDRALRTQSQTLDRNGLGVPLYTASEQPDGLQGVERTERQQEEIDAGSALAQAWRAGDDSGAAIPHGAQLELKGVVGDLPDADPVIRYYDEQIARAVLAHFLNLGTETGSWALGSTFADFFTLSLQTIAAHIAEVTTAHVIEDLVDLNYGPDEPAPRLVWDEIGSRHPATPEAIRALIQCGVIVPDDDLEAALRITYGLPAADPNTARALPDRTVGRPPDSTDPEEKMA